MNSTQKFRITTELEMGGRCHLYAVLRDGDPLPFSDVLDLWQGSDPFRTFFIDVLKASPFAAYRWETPPLTADTLQRPFEFVLVNAPGLDLHPDPTAFRQHFTSASPDIVAFENLGRDALMVVPSPRVDETAYGHLAAFVRRAPAEQVHALWQTVGQQVIERTGERPLWLSTAGGGVAWLHVRLDSRSEYYSYRPYTSA